MRATSIIFRRELGAYLSSPVGYVVAALMLLIDGIFFQTQALGAGNRLSADVLSTFFMYTGVVTVCAGVILSVRLVAEERQQHTIVLLNTSPIRDAEIIAGKFLSALAFLTGIIALSVYMPLLIFVNGKIAISQLLIGYLGVFLLGAASIAIGIFASSLARQQLVAAAVGASVTGLMVLFYLFAKRLDAPLKDVFQNLDLWWVHFQGGFMIGIFNLKDLIYYFAVTYFFLLLATKTLEAKRWQ